MVVYKIKKGIFNIFINKSQTCESLPHSTPFFARYPRTTYLNIQSKLTDAFYGRFLEDLDNLWQLDDTRADHDCESDQLRDGELMALHVLEVVGEVLVQAVFPKNVKLHGWLDT